LPALQLAAILATAVLNNFMIALLIASVSELFEEAISRIYVRRA
jgi:hypothetical protein